MNELYYSPDLRYRLEQNKLKFAQEQKKRNGREVKRWIDRCHATGKKWFIRKQDPEYNWTQDRGKKK